MKRIVIKITTQPINEIERDGLSPTSYNINEFSFKITLNVVYVNICALGSNGKQRHFLNGLVCRNLDERNERSFSSLKCVREMYCTCSARRVEVFNGLVREMSGFKDKRNSIRTGRQIVRPGCESQQL